MHLAVSVPKVFTFARASGTGFPHVTRILRTAYNKKISEDSHHTKAAIQKVAWKPTLTHRLLDEGTVLKERQALELAQFTWVRSGQGHILARAVPSSRCTAPSRLQLSRNRMFSTSSQLLPSTASGPRV